MLRKLFLTAALVGAVCALSSAQSVDDIIAKNVQARGGTDKLKSVQTLRSSGKMEMGPMEAPGSMVQKRPDMLRIDFTVQGLTAVQAYDGKEAWAIMPFTGKKDPELMPADDTKEMQEDADIDGPLVDYKAKGNQVELMGKEDVEGTPAYKLKVTMKHGDVKYMYLDTDSGLQIKEEEKRMIRGTEQDTDTIIGDYREVNGMMFPFAIDSGIKGSAERQKLTIDKVEVNAPVDDASFKMPPAAPAPASKPEDKKQPPAKP